MTEKRNTKTRQWNAVPMAVMILGCLTIAMLVWMREINERQRANFALIDDLLELQMKTATAHLWFEEALTEQMTAKQEMAWMNFEKARGDFDEAVKLSNIIRRGGEFKYSLSPTHDAAFNALADKVSAFLLQLDSLTELRRANPAEGRTGSAMDSRYNAIFSEIHDAIDELEDVQEQKMADDYGKTTQLYFGIVFAWAIIVIAATLGLWNHEVRKRRAEDALKVANDNLEAKVAERTGELAAANDQLNLELAERMQAEDALRVSEQQFRGLSQQFHALLESIADPLLLLSPDLKVIWANRGAAVHLGKDSAVLEGMHCHEVLHGASVPCEECPAAKSMALSQEQTSTLETRDGRLWELRTFPVRDEAGSAVNVLLTAIDITEKTMLQREAERAAHLASLGELAAGVAHEINNPVNGIISCAEILVRKSKEESREHDIGKRIIREGSRIAYIVKSLLSFARVETEEKVPVEVRQLLADTLALTEAQMKKEGIDLQVNFGDATPMVRVQPQKLEQVFLNIINNARDALNEKYPESDEAKALRISTDRVTTNGKPMVRIIFRDQGAGIPEDVLHRVMNPFFSTKPKGRGTGLGLSISHGIVASHGGVIAIDSSLGAYTEVAVELPVLEG